jgi:hypothetical protein
MHETTLGPLPKPLCYRNSLPDFLQGLTSITKVEINLQYHSAIVDINENQQYIPTIHQPKPTI